MLVRLFLAIELDPEVRRGVAEATAPLRAAAPSLRWVAESRLHMTVEFLGEQPDEVAAALPAALDDVSHRHRAFAMVVGGVGAFPNFRRPRVVWMGVALDPRLELLHHDVEVACDRIGHALDGRPFRPHVTLARARGHVAREELAQLRAARDAMVFGASSVVSSVDLMCSITGADARYERMHAARLRAS